MGQIISLFSEQNAVPKRNSRRQTRELNKSIEEESPIFVSTPVKLPKQWNTDRQQNQQECENKIREKDAEIKKCNNTISYKEDEINKLKEQNKKLNETKKKLEEKNAQSLLDLKKDQEKILKQQQEEFERLLTVAKEKEESIQQLMKEKEILLNEKKQLENTTLEQEGKIMILRSELYGGNLNDNLVSDTPSQIKDAYIDLKVDLRNMVTTIVGEMEGSTEDKEIEMECLLSFHLLKELKPSIVNHIRQTYSITEDEEIGKKLMVDKELVQKLSQLTCDQLENILKHKLCLNANNSLILEKHRGSLFKLCNNCIQFFVRMMSFKRRMDLVWYDENTKFNPYEQSSQNGTREILVESVLFPCLMIVSNNIVYETALVRTKDKKLK